MWFSIFWENLISLPAWAWILWALVVVSAVAFFLVKKKSNAAVPVAVVLLAAQVVLFAFALPSIQPEEGASTAAMFLYSPLFWSAVIAVLGIACIVLLLRRQKWTIQMLSTDLKMDCLFAHEVTVRPLENGNFQYVGNRITYQTEYGLPHSVPRLMWD